MLISPFTPLFFGSRKSDGMKSRYVQTFAPTDRILVQVFLDAGENCSLYIVDDDTGARSSIALQTYQINSATKMCHAVLTGLSNGYYRVYIPVKVSEANGTGHVSAVVNLPFSGSFEIAQNDALKDLTISGTVYSCLESEVFCVTDDEAVLSRTTLIQYSNKDNKQRTDAYFSVEGVRYFFDFRVPGGFKDSSWKFSVDNEQFLTPDGDYIEMYALESTQQDFTMGHQEGVPVVFAELLNRLLTCTYVYFDGVRYSRRESSAPEMSVQMEGLDSFVFTQALQKVNNLNPTIENANRLIMRRVDTTTYLAVDSGTNRIT